MQKKASQRNVPKNARMKRAILVASFVSLGVLSGCGPGIPPVGNYATVSGTVVDASSNQPIANATMTIDSVFVSTTDGGGHYRVANVPYGPWSYVASAPNYGSKSETSPPDLLAGEQRTFPVSLTHS